MTHLDPEKLLSLLTEQREMYRRLQELSGKQRRLIAGNQPELLLQILRERQQTVSGLARLNEQLAPYRRDWDAVRGQLPDEARHQALELLEEINGLLRDILRADKEDTALLSTKKQAVGQSLADLSGGKAANAAYAKSPAAGGGADISG